VADAIPLDAKASVSAGSQATITDYQDSGMDVQIHSARRRSSGDVDLILNGEPYQTLAPGDTTVIPYRDGDFSITLVLHVEHMASGDGAHQTVEVDVAPL
jgi:hypothetical protein